MMLTMTLLYPDVHVPTATVSGDIVTVNADFAYLDVEPLEVVQGTILTDTSLIASKDGKLPVSWRLPPGTYSITAFGFPDNRMLPNRNKAILTVTVENPTRQKQITDALQRFSLANIEAEVAREEIKTLKPTRAEISAALVP